jgi:hypothetical protein
MPLIRRDAGWALSTRWRHVRETFILSSLGDAGGLLHRYREVGQIQRSIADIEELGRYLLRKNFSLSLGAFGTDFALLLILFLSLVQDLRIAIFLRTCSHVFENIFAKCYGAMSEDQ